ncbi:class I SAM-dependent methyltransferase [Roseiconus nitratireducens]|uniref:Class I SAM-dependent methyltransferase n=1 Tax=Roseiconus nitratireducens TaxID=2605748 RepID=A0A5M6D0G8_9BACT|nr:class I SAM-dependent methyltransferase [Roseiconus nitratireducens]KAA5540944.1 class I SAM-dependent methyltransferase [Roseiconus nitratireducens]
MTNVSNFYHRRVAPRVVHHLCSCAQITRQRQEVVSQAFGLVLEIGIGSGLNLPHYDPDKVERVIGVDPDASMLQLSATRRESTSISVEMIQASAAEMPLESGLADCAMITYTLCSVQDPRRVLAEVARVLKPQGVIYLCEHGRATGRMSRGMQSAANGAWSRLMLGCNLNRDPNALVLQSGFRFLQQERFVMRPFPPMLGTHYTGVAVRA